MASENETTESQTLQWFRSSFSKVEQNGFISLRDFKHASHRSCHVSSHHADSMCMPYGIIGYNSV